MYAITINSFVIDFFIINSHAYIGKSIGCDIVFLDIGGHSRARTTGSPRFFAPDYAKRDYFLAENMLTIMTTIIHGHKLAI